MLRRTGIIGDVHAEDISLEAILAFMQEQQCDSYLCVGDIVDGRGDVNRCCDLLRKHNVLAVRGNHERWMASNQMRTLSDSHRREQIQPHHLTWLEALPVDLSLDTPHGKLLLCHGLGTNDMDTLLPDETGYALTCKPELERILYERDYAFVVSGHSHRRMFRTLDRTAFINAGTLRYLNQPCCVIVDFEKRRVQFYDVDGTACTTAQDYEF